jgi:hypothetical protein
MAEIDFEPNNRYNIVENKKKDEKPERRAVKTVAKGRRKKKSVIKRLTDNFEDMEKVSLKEKIIDDALVPGIKELLSDMVGGLLATISDTVEDALDITLWGEKRGKKGKKGKKNGTKVSYSSYYDDKNDRKSSKKVKKKLDIDEVWFETRKKAQEALDELLEMIEDYDNATVADLYSAAEEEYDSTDEAWGWKDLSAAYVTRGREGFMINLPKPIVLD